MRIPVERFLRSKNCNSHVSAMSDTSCSNVQRIGGYKTLFRHSAKRLSRLSSNTTKFTDLKCLHFIEVLKRDNSVVGAYFITSLNESLLYNYILQQPLINNLLYRYSFLYDSVFVDFDVHRNALHKFVNTHLLFFAYPIGRCTCLYCGYHF